MIASTHSRLTGSMIQCNEKELQSWKWFDNLSHEYYKWTLINLKLFSMSTHRVSWRSYHSFSAILFLLYLSHISLHNWFFLIFTLLVKSLDTPAHWKQMDRCVQTLLFLIEWHKADLPSEHIGIREYVNLSHLMALINSSLLVLALLNYVSYSVL